MTLFRSRNENSRSRKRVIRTCCEGEVVDISRSSNPAIASKILGEGVCILCSQPDIHAPLSGVVTDVSDNGHTYSITADDGIVLLVCIKADSKKEVIEPKVAKGDSVEAGDLLCSKENAEAAVIVTNVELTYKFHVALGNTRTPEDGVIVYEL